MYFRSRELENRSCSPTKISQTRHLRRSQCRFHGDTCWSFRKVWLQKVWQSGKTVRLSGVWCYTCIDLCAYHYVTTLYNWVYLEISYSSTPGYTLVNHGESSISHLKTRRFKGSHSRTLPSGAQAGNGRQTWEDASHGRSRDPMENRGKSGKLMILGTKLE